jgi:hypothetical protein
MRNILNFIVFTIFISCSKLNEQKVVLQAESRNNLNSKLQSKHSKDSLMFDKILNNGYKLIRADSSKCDSIFLNGYGCVVNKSKNFITASEKLNAFQRNVDQPDVFRFNLDNIKLIKHFSFVSSQKTKDPITLRFSVEQWELTSENFLIEFKAQLERMTVAEKFQITKAPLEWVGKDDKVYFIITNGGYMEKEILRIKKLIEI